MAIMARYEESGEEPGDKDKGKFCSEEQFRAWVAKAIQLRAESTRTATDKESMVSILIDQVFFGAVTVGYSTNDVLATMKARAEEFAKQTPYPNLIPGLQNWGKNV